MQAPPEGYITFKEASDALWLTRHGESDKPAVFVDDHEKSRRVQAEIRVQNEKVRDAMFSPLKTGILRAFFVDKTFGKFIPVPKDYWSTGGAQAYTIATGVLEILDQNGSDFAGHHHQDCYFRQAEFEAWFEKYKQADFAPVEGPTTQEHPRPGDRETNAKKASKYQRIVDYARNKWPSEKAPDYTEMAEIIVNKKKGEGLSYETIRKLLAGQYQPARKLDISGYVPGG